MVDLISKIQEPFKTKIFIKVSVYGIGEVRAQTGKSVAPHYSRLVVGSSERKLNSFDRQHQCVI